MKHFRTTHGRFLLIGLFPLFMTSCENGEKRSVPEIQNAQINGSTEFGDSISFKVKVTDVNIIQNVTAAIYYDGLEASRTTLRNVTDGVYEGRLYVPVASNVADGDFSVVFLALNNLSGHSEVVKTVHCTHTDYPYITFVATDGGTYRFERSAKYEYVASGTFPGQVSGYFCSPVPTKSESASGKQQVFWGANGSNIVAGSRSSISLVNSDEEELKNISLKFNTLTFVTEVPMLPSTFKLTSNGLSIKKELKKNQTIYFEGLPDGYWIDVDFFEKTKEGYLFKAESGQYKVTREDAYNYIRVERMNGNDYATYDGNTRNEAIWCIGNGNFGKPTKANVVNWDTSKGLCMAKVGDNLYQLTVKLYSGLGIKFFWQKGWGGEFKKANYTLIDSPFFGVKEAGDMEQTDGNKILATQYTNDDKYYRITLDVSSGLNAVKLHCIEIDL